MTSIEYGLIGALIAMAIVLALVTAGDALVDAYQWVADWIGWVVNYAMGGPDEPMPGS